MVLSHSISNFLVLWEYPKPISAVRIAQPMRVVRPLFLCMSAVGVLRFQPQTNVVEAEGNGNNGSNGSKRKQRKYGAWLCIVTAILVWANILRMTPKYVTIRGFDEGTFTKIGILFWYLQCGINSLVCVRANIKTDMLARLYGLWSEYCLTRSFERNVRPLRRIVWFLMVTYVLFVVCNIALIAYVMYGDDPNMACFKCVLFTPFTKESEVLKVVLMLFQAYVAGTWILPLWLFALVCIVNKYMLEDTRVALLEHYDERSKFYTGNLEAVRQRHQAACDMVECADHAFCLFVALGIGTDLPLACFVLYMLIWPEAQSAYMLIFNGFLLIMVAFHLVVIIWSAARVNTEAHAACTQLHRITMHSLSESQRFQLLVFLSRVQGPPIGMTAWQMFTIDRPSLLAIMSILLTYFVILIQMRMPAGAPGNTNSTLTTMD